MSGRGSGSCPDFQSKWIAGRSGRQWSRPPSQSAVARDLGTEIEVRDGVKAGDEAILVNIADGNPVHSQASTSNIDP
jgi:hypothetical protein